MNYAKIPELRDRDSSHHQGYSPNVRGTFPFTSSDVMGHQPKRSSGGQAAIQELIEQRVRSAMATASPKRIGTARSKADRLSVRKKLQASMMTKASRARPKSVLSQELSFEVGRGASRASVGSPKKKKKQSKCVKKQSFGASTEATCLMKQYQSQIAGHPQDQEALAMPAPSHSRKLTQMNPLGTDRANLSFMQGPLASQRAGFQSARPVEEVAADTTIDGGSRIDGSRESLNIKIVSSRERLNQQSSKILSKLAKFKVGNAQIIKQYKNQLESEYNEKTRQKSKDKILSKYMKKKPVDTQRFSKQSSAFTSALKKSQRARVSATKASFMEPSMSPPRTVRAAVKKSLGGGLKTSKKGKTKQGKRTRSIQSARHHMMNLQEEPVDQEGGPQQLFQAQNRDLGSSVFLQQAPPADLSEGLAQQLMVRQNSQQKEDSNLLSQNENPHGILLDQLEAETSVLYKEVLEQSMRNVAPGDLKQYFSKEGPFNERRGPSHSLNKVLLHPTDSRKMKSPLAQAQLYKQMTTQGKSHNDLEAQLSPLIRGDTDRFVIPSAAQPESTIVDRQFMEQDMNGGGDFVQMFDQQPADASPYPDASPQVPVTKQEKVKQQIQQFKDNFERELLRGLQPQNLSFEQHISENPLAGYDEFESQEEEGPQTSELAKTMMKTYDSADHYQVIRGKFKKSKDYEGARRTCTKLFQHALVRQSQQKIREQIRKDQELIQAAELMKKAVEQIPRMSKQIQAEQNNQPLCKRTEDVLKAKRENTQRKKFYELQKRKRLDPDEYSPSLHPKILKKSKQYLSCNEMYRESHESMSRVVQRTMAFLKNRDKKVESMVKEAAEKESFECTFRPKTNTKKISDVRNSEPEPHFLVLPMELGLPSRNPTLTSRGLTTLENQSNTIDTSIVRELPNIGPEQGTLPTKEYEFKLREYEQKRADRLNSIKSYHERELNFIPQIHSRQAASSSQTQKRLQSLAAKFDFGRSVKTPLDRFD